MPKKQIQTRKMRASISHNMRNHWCFQYTHAVRTIRTYHIREKRRTKYQTQR